MTERDLRRLARQHYDRLFRAARFMCADPSVAEDLVQETFLAAAESLKSFEGRSSVYTWLYGILLNKFRHWLRRKDAGVVSLHAGDADGESRSPEEFLQTDQPGPDQAAERRELTELVRDAIQQLSLDHRSVITLRYIEGMSYEEIAQALGCPIGTVKSRIHYALLRIAEKLPEGGAGPGGGPTAGGL